MRLAEQWTSIANGLDPNWGDARLALTVDDEPHVERAAALLAPAGPGRYGRTIRFYVTRSGTGVGPEAIRRMMRRLDQEQIRGTLELVSVDEAPPREPGIARRSLAEEWDAALRVLPSDWSDLLGELELTSSDYLDRAALLLGPINPLHSSDELRLRFRCAHSFGYGAAPGVVRRCLARLDEAGIPGDVRIVRVLSDSHPVATQGPVWYVGGKAV
jgi:hypothetical protein